MADAIVGNPRGPFYRFFELRPGTWCVEAAALPGESQRVECLMAASAERVGADEPGFYSGWFHERVDGTRFVREWYPALSVRQREWMDFIAEGGMAPMWAERAGGDWGE